MWGPPSHPGASALPGDAGRHRGPRSELEAATVPGGESAPALHPFPQPHRFSSLTGPPTPTLDAWVTWKARGGGVGGGKQAPWGGGGAILDRPGQLSALLSPFTFLPPPPTWLCATFSLFSFLVAPFLFPPEGSGGLRDPRILLVLTHNLGQGPVDRSGRAWRPGAVQSGIGSFEE